ncbi:sulfate ABC transporter permease subunit [Nocardioides speluncae]|uniref:sulfate ABC transporter permease subunit n=1 Tax=Nocardioides speluncae TaxID=2670337 RepID=UPI001F0C4677|nr:sulfate ABC transporter permease subunit [Nocardioides speluncae]
MVKEPRLFRIVLGTLVCGYVFMLVLWPVALVAQKTFEGGLDNIQTALQNPEVTHALLVTAKVAGLAVLINMVFGVTMSLLLVRSEFPGKRLVSALIDVPLSVSPVVVGFALVLVYNGLDGWFGPTLEANGLIVIFNTPGMVMATCFVALPLVIREVVPVLTEIGDDQEQAARSLGANGRQTFWRITLPSIKWAVVYGVVLSLARSIGEYGAVRIVGTNVAGDSQTATQYVTEAHNSPFPVDHAAAYTVSFILAAVAVLCIVVVSLLRPKEAAK